MKCDALPPQVLGQIINDAVDEFEDNVLMQAVIDREEKDRELLQELSYELMNRRENDAPDT